MSARPDWLMNGDWPAGSREARAKVAWELREAGYKVIEIGSILGVKRSTAGALLSDPDGSQAANRKRKRHGVCIDCGAHTYNSGAKARDLPERCRSCRVAFVKSDMDTRRDASRRNRGRYKYSDAEILAALRMASRDGQISGPIYDRAYEAAPRGSMPSQALVVRRFGLWSSAAAAAGLDCVGGARGPYRSRFTDEGLLLAVGECAAEVGRTPSYNEYAKWAAAVGAPSAELLRARFGRWMDAVDRFDLQEVA